MVPDKTLPLPGGVTWSIEVRRADADVPLLRVQPDQVCATASIGKVLLLTSVAESIVAGRLDPMMIVRRGDVPPVRDSGLWQHLQADEVCLADLCLLVGAVSDNLATNALIGVVGLDAANLVAERLELQHTALHDLVRDTRLAHHPAALSTATAAELAVLLDDLSTRLRRGEPAAAQVVRWLSTNTDLSMVASAFALDPLAHGDTDRGVRLWNKTGTNDGVRCDIGVVTSGDDAVTYAVLANWDPSDPSDALRDEVLSAMNQIGLSIRNALR